MPVNTDSELWDSASREDSTKTGLKKFLKSNPNKAFTAEELCVEVVGADFGIDIPQEELPLEEMFGRVMGSTQAVASDEAFIKTHLSTLVYEDDVEVRLIPTTVDGVETERAHYTISD